MVQPDPWVGIATALIGTFTGAALAFGSNFFFQRRQRRRENLTAGHVATLVVAQQWGDYAFVRRGFLEWREQRLRADPATPAWLQFKPTVYAFSESLRFDLKSLAFLAETKHFAVLQKLLMVVVRYRDLQLLIEQFNAAATLLQKELLAVGVRGGEPFILEEVERRLPVALRANNDSLARALILRFDEDEHDYRDGMDSLHTALVDCFGKKDVIKAEPLVEPSSRAPNQARE